MIAAPTGTRLRLALTTVLLTTALLVPTTAANAAPAQTATATATATAKHYKNCTAVNQVYSGGIAKAGVKYNLVKSGGKTIKRALKGNVKFSTALYNANKSLDRDNDGIACEKS